MRKFTLFIIFSLVCISIYGQTMRDQRIYIAPIEGLGKEAENDYFFQRLNYEIILQKNKPVKSVHESDYTFKSTIGFASEISNDDSGNFEIRQPSIESPVPKNPSPPIKNDFGKREFFSMANGNKYFFYDSSGLNNTLGNAGSQTDQAIEKEYYFKIDMIDSNSGEIISNQILIFVTADPSIDKLISTAVKHLFSDTSDFLSKRGDSLNRWLYFETSALWVPSFFFNNELDPNLFNFGLNFGVEFHFLKFLSFCTGARFIYEQFETPSDTVTDITFGIPASIKVTFYLKKIFELAPYLGAIWNNSLSKSTQPSDFSGFAGVQFGIKDKQEIGLFVFDAGFSIDFSDSSIPNTSITYKRFNVFLGVGYKFGILQRKDNIK